MSSSKLTQEERKRRADIASIVDGFVENADPDERYIVAVGETLIALRAYPQKTAKSQSPPRAESNSFSSRLIVSPMEYHLIREWQANKYPLPVVIDALHSVVESLERAGKFADRKLPLRYAAPAVDEACAEAAELAGRVLTW